jgi:uncharacterized protein (TIGR03067 family)
MHRYLSVLVVLAAPLLLTAGDDDVAKELKALRGKWKAVALEANGMQLPKEALPDFTFTVGADGKSSGKMPKGEYESKLVVDPKKDPKTIDNAYESGPHKGQKQFGIYKRDGDKWTVCMTAPGAAEKDRPKTFDTKGTANVVFIFERVKEDKKD